MPNKIPTIKFLLPLAAALVLISWAGTWQDIEVASQKITSIQARFTQTKNMALLARPLVSTGSFHYRQPGALRWEYDSPVRSVLLLHKGSVRRYVKSKKGLVEDDAARLKSMAVVLQEITSWFGGKFDRNPDFTARLTDNPERTIVLTPKNEGLKNIIASIELTLSKKPGVINRVIIREGEKNTTLLDFSDISINSTIPESLFTKP